MSDYLLIGPVLLQNFELPPRIFWGGAQRTAIHRLPGGGRIIDSMGRDDAPITWCGVFTGTNAVLRARALDLMRAEGGVWPLTFSSFFYSVIVSEFQADYASSNWIPYRVCCTVLRDEVEALVTTAVSVVAGALADLTSAAAFGADTGGAVSAIALPDAATVGTAAYAGSLLALTGVNANSASTIDRADKDLANSDPTSSAGLAAATDAAGRLANQTAARGYLGRAQTNLVNAGT